MGSSTHASSTTSSAATTSPSRCVDRCLRGTRSRGKILCSFRDISILTAWVRNVTVQEYKWEKQCDDITVTRKECKTDYEVQNRTVTTQKCNQYLDNVCANYTVPQYEVVRK